MTRAAVPLPSAAGPWVGFLDLEDGPPDDLPPAWAAYVGSRRVADTDLPTTAPAPGSTDDDGSAGHPLRLVVTGGAGQLAGPVALAARRGLRLDSIEVTVRDPDDPAGNTRRVVAAVDDARSTGALDPDTEIHLVLTGAPAGRWLDAADEAAAAGLELVLPLGRGGDDVPGWIDAALDREVPFSLEGGDVAAAVSAVGTTAALWEPGTSPTDPGAIAAARRWCRSWRCPDLAAAATHLDTRA